MNMEPVLSAEGIAVANVSFLPGSYTNWHRHENGQLLQVKAGKGWICDRGSTPRRIASGDVIWCPAGTVHWHGADVDCYMMHQAVSHGTVEWLEKVDESQYAAVAGKDQSQ